MGGWFSKMFGNKEMRILMLGLDSAGKTSTCTRRERARESAREHGRARESAGERGRVRESAEERTRGGRGERGTGSCAMVRDG